MTAGVAALTLVASCATWRVQWISPETVIRRDQPGAVEVTRVDSSRVVVHHPEIVRDSLVGDVDGVIQRMALGDVAYVAVRRGDAGGNAGMMLLAALAGLVALGIAVAASLQ